MTFKKLEHPQLIGRISHIAIYPVKSAGMVEKDHAVLTPSGIEGDRQFMVVRRDPDEEDVHKFVTQRELPKMALIAPEMRDGSIRLTWNGSDPIEIPRDNSSGEIMRVRIWDDIPYAQDQGKALVHWLSDHLETPLRLVRNSDPSGRSVSQKYMHNVNHVFFQDGYPVHWFLQESLNELSKITGVPVPWRNFRPNIVVEGGEAQAEHLVYSGMIGGIPFQQPKPCDRCTIPTVDQDSGERTYTIVTKALAQYKNWRNKENQRKMIFGENALPLAVGEIAVGGEVLMTAIRDPPLAYGAKA